METSKTLFLREQILDNCHFLFPTEDTLRIVTSTTGDYVMAICSSTGAIKILLDCGPAKSTNRELECLYQKTRERVAEKMGTMKTTLKDSRRDSNCSSNSNSSGSTSSGSIGSTMSSVRSAIHKAPTTTVMLAARIPGSQKPKKSPVYRLDTLPHATDSCAQGPDDAYHHMERDAPQKVSQSIIPEGPEPLHQRRSGLGLQLPMPPQQTPREMMAIQARLSNYFASQSSHSQHAAMSDQRSFSDPPERGRRMERGPIGLQMQRSYTPPPESEDEYEMVGNKPYNNRHGNH